MFKVFIQTYWRNQLIGVSILCESFDNLEDAKQALISHTWSKNEIQTKGFIKEYSTDNSVNIIGGRQDTGKLLVA